MRASHRCFLPRLRGRLRGRLFDSASSRPLCDRRLARRDRPRGLPRFRQGTLRFRDLAAFDLRDRDADPNQPKPEYDSREDNQQSGLQQRRAESIVCFFQDLSAAAARVPLPHDVRCTCTGPSPRAGVLAGLSLRRTGTHHDQHRRNCHKDGGDHLAGPQSSIIPAFVRHAAPLGHRLGISAGARAARASRPID